MKHAFKNKKLKKSEIAFKKEFLRVIHEAGLDARKLGLQVAGFVVEAEDGWVIKQYADGRKEKIEKIEEVPIPSKRDLISVIQRDGGTIKL